MMLRVNTYGLLAHCAAGHIKRSLNYSYWISQFEPLKNNKGACKWSCVRIYKVSSIWSWWCNYTHIRLNLLQKKWNLKMTRATQRDPFWRGESKKSRIWGVRAKVNGAIRWEWRVVKSRGPEQFHLVNPVWRIYTYTVSIYISKPQKQQHYFCM